VGLSATNRIIYRRLAKVCATIDAIQQLDDALLEQIEQSSSETSLKEQQNDLIALQSRLQQLNWIEDQFNNLPLKKKSTSSC
jgi:hypothetical protein